MSFQAVSVKVAPVSTSAVAISNSTFGFASTDLAGAQKAIISPTSASVRICTSTDTPVQATGIGVFVSTGTSFTVFGAANVANLKVVSTSTVVASVCIQIEK